MKKLTLLFLILFSTQLSAQEKKMPIDNTTAGGQLQVAAKHYYKGISTIIASSAIGTLLVVGSGGDESARLMGDVVMGVGGLIGTIMVMESWSHIRKAGKIMDGQKISLAPSKTGIGICINF